jgi:hypothetical protein
VAGGGAQAALAAKQATSALPIVFAATAESPALRDQAAMSRGCPSSSRS